MSISSPLSGCQALPAQKNSAVDPSGWSHQIRQLCGVNSSGLDEQAFNLPSSWATYFILLVPSKPSGGLKSAHLCKWRVHLMCKADTWVPTNCPTSPVPLSVLPSWQNHNWYACFQVILVPKNRGLISSKGPVVMLTVSASDAMSFVELRSHIICPCCSVSTGLSNNAASRPHRFECQDFPSADKLQCLVNRYEHTKPLQKYYW